MVGQVKSDVNKAKTVSLVGKCGRCGRQFFAEAELPLITFEDDEGHEYKGVAAPHLVLLCPYDNSLLNLAKRVEVNKFSRLKHGYP